MAQVDQSLSIAQPHPNRVDVMGKIGLALSVSGLLVLVLALFNLGLEQASSLLAFSLSATTVGTCVYSWRLYRNKPVGIKNNRVFLDSLTNRGLWGWVAGVILTALYVVLYWFPELLGLTGKEEANTGLIALFDPLKQLFDNDGKASEWFFYGTMYTVAILAMGFKFILKYRHNAYQVIRTISVMFWQLGFAFLIPEVLSGLNNKVPYYDFKNMWPLNYYFTDEWSVNSMLEAGSIGMFMLLFGVAMIFIVSPVLTYFYGKRWYCSWVCGCGGLAETAGDPWRQNSDKSLKAWRIERWLIHSVLIFVIVTTIAVVFTYIKPGNDGYWLTRVSFASIVSIILGGVVAAVFLWPKLRKEIDGKVRLLAAVLAVAIVGAVWYSVGVNSQHVFFVDSYKLREWYGFAIGSAFAGVAGVGFYPILGSRVWCRFGCPMAAILGLQQRFFSRFRITTNGGQCISCGNCSTYCEMGIDVRYYAQRGQNIVRASCVGCGICSAVCPRGVLKLENLPVRQAGGPAKGRVSDDPILIGNDGASLNVHVS